MSTLVIYDGDVAYPVTDDVLNLTLNDASISFDLKLKFALAAEWQGERLLVACYTDSQTNDEYWYRLARPTLRTGVYHFDGFGYSTALQDLRYSETWSTQRLTNWQQIQNGTPLGDDFRNDIFYTNLGQAIEMGLIKNTRYNDTGNHDRVGWQYSLVSASGRFITGIYVNFDQIWSGTIACDLMIEGFNANYTSAETVVLGNLPGAGPAGSESVAIFHEFSATNIKHVIAWLRTTTASSVLYTGETNANAFNITAVRLVTGGEFIDTTATTGVITAGVPVVITPADMTGIQNGTKLVFAGAEEVIASSVTSTTFTMTTAFNYTAATRTIKGIAWLRCGAIIADILNRLAVLNGSGLVNLINSTINVSETEIDYTDAEYTNADAFALLGQFAADANVKWGVTSDRRLWFGTEPAPRTWYILADDIEIAKPLETVINSLQATYVDELGVEQQTTRRTNASAINALGITRQSVLATDATTLANANTQRNAVLDGFDYRVAQARYSFKHVQTGEGVRVSPLEVKTGDTIIVINLPVYLAPQLKDRSIVVADWRYDAFAGVITVTPESQLPTLEVLLAAK